MLRSVQQGGSLARHLLHETNGRDGVDFLGRDGWFSDRHGLWLSCQWINTWVQPNPDQAYIRIGLLRLLLFMAVRVTWRRGDGCR